ncbi:MAG: hypothetical protein KDD36_11820, partial [Flavobacteriales bacterium]|nr:hypothetical protein [Flavobacteriales bacterium]
KVLCSKLFFPYTVAFYKVKSSVITSNPSTNRFETCNRVPASKGKPRYLAGFFVLKETVQAAEA